MSRRSLARLAILAAAIALVSACGAPEQEAAKPSPPDAKGGTADPQESLKVGFVYVGPVGDYGWTHAHDQGRQALEAALPGIETTFVESVKEGPDAERVLSRLAEAGHDLVFATSFGYMDAVLAAGEKYPGTAFMHATGFRRSKNVGTYFGRVYEPIYLTGLAAGKLTREGKIGFVAPIPIPEIIRHINAFTLGARKTNPSCSVQVIWTNAWYDPPTEKDAARSLMDAGCDIIMTEGDSPAPIQAAEERGIFAIGYNSDSRAFAPTRYVTASIWNWGLLYQEIARQVRDGAWSAEDVWWGMETGICGLAPWGPGVPEEVRDLVEREREEIVQGRLEIFTGPIRKQDGSEAYPEGETATDPELIAMSYFVEGVEGSIPETASH